jgi:hypothetical protein
MSAEALLFNYHVLRIPRADYPLGIYVAVHINCDPAIIHEHEI